MGDHHCHAQGCEVPVPPKMLMCRRHWSMVPGDIQREVYAHFNPRQCIRPGLRVPPTREWLAAARAAIDAVAAQGRPRNPSGG